MCSDVVANNSLTHSSEAVSVTAQFYNKEVVVYVEGPDDVPFWDSMFSKVVSRDFYVILPVNGKEQLTPIVADIENGTIQNVFVAADLDYNLFTEKGRSASSYIIYTYGHSIENTMFCPKNVSIFLRRAIKKTVQYSNDVDLWFQSTLTSALPILAMDILNCIDVDCKYHKSNGNNALLGRGYYFYQDQLQNKHIDVDKIRHELASHPDFDMSMLAKLEKDIESICHTRDPRFLVQGHFLADAVMNFIRVSLVENKQKASYSKDALYSLFCDCIERCEPLCHDKQHVCAYIEKAVREYKNSITAA